MPMDKFNTEFNKSIGQYWRVTATGNDMTDKQTLQLIGNSAGYYLKAYIHNMFKVLPLWSANVKPNGHEQVLMSLDPQEPKIS